MTRTHRPSHPAHVRTRICTRICARTRAHVRARACTRTRARIHGRHLPAAPALIVLALVLACAAPALASLRAADITGQEPPRPEAKPDSGAGSAASPQRSDLDQRIAPAPDLAQAIDPVPAPAPLPPIERAPAITAVGGYGGFPSMAGLQIVAPVDARMAFRAGLTGFPGIGALWTPGFEVRFGQVPGTFNTDSGYAWTDLYWGRSVWNDKDRAHHGLEAGLGYRWILPDRRGVRWIAALEAGGFWTPAHAYPIRPAIRASWMIATP